jgi:chromosome segregation ATPase
VANLTIEINDLNSDRQRLSCEIEVYKGSVADLILEVNDLNSDRQRLSCEIETYKGSMADLTTEKGALIKNNKDERQKLREIRQTIQTEEVRIRE